MAIRLNKVNGSGLYRPRKFTAMTYDETTRQVILFGGRVAGSSNVQSPETWAWNGSG